MTTLLPWQHPQWQQLTQRKASGRLPHALLCSGPVGVGKTSFARYLAQALLCKTPAADGSPCGVCRGCRLFLAGSHPDYTQVEPAEPGKPIKVDQVRELCAFLSYTSQFEGAKLALLVPAERMNINAANSLLKTLEEPPADSLLLLVSALPSRLPATVRSRCQRVMFHLPSLEQGIAWLAPQVAEADPALLLRLAGGAPLTALDYAEPGHLAQRRELFRGYSEVLLGKLNSVQAAQTWLQGDMAENLGWLIGWQMDMIRLKVANEPPWLYNPDLQPVLQRLAERVSVQTLFEQLDAACRLHELSATQVNPQLMIEAFLGNCAGT